MLQRQGRSSRPRETPADTTHAPVTAYEPGYRPVDVNYLPQLAAETTRRDRCVAMDRATRGVCIPIKANKTAASAQSLLAALAPGLPDQDRQPVDRQRPGLHGAPLRVA